MKHISCLPVAGEENPYQKLMMNGLKEAKNLEVKHGSKNKIFGILLTAIFQRPDYIHFDWIHQYYYRGSKWMTYLNFPIFILQVWVVRNILRTKLVWTLHNIMPHDSPTNGPYLWSRIFFANQVEWIRVFDKGTVDRASTMFKLPRSMFKIIPEGSYVGYYPNDLSRAESRGKLSISTEEKVYLFFGSIRPYKGIEELINAFHSLDKGELIIAGNCKSKAYLNELVELINKNPRIIFKPASIDVEDVQIYMNSADIVVLPFKKIENSGSVILAMGFKKPVIAPNIGILPTRLKAQLELLYDDDLTSKIKRVSMLSEKELSDIGSQNYQNLLLNKWNDLAQEF